MTKAAKYRPCNAPWPDLLAAVRFHLYCTRTAGHPGDHIARGYLDRWGKEAKIGRKSQTERILALLRERGRLGLTPKEALAEVGTMRLAARIADLRAAGHLISTETFTTPNGARVARYVLYGDRVTWDELRERLKAGRAAMLQVAEEKR